ncbi:hypothetical protein [Streptomyces zhihengii]
MSALSVEERGDMAQRLVPEAAALVVDVHEGTPALIAERLHSLDRHQLEGLAVVLAALVDPDAGLRESLAWVTFDEHGDRLPVRERATSVRSVREAVPAGARQHARGVDEVAVERALRGDQTVPLNRDERRHAVDVGIRRGMGYDNVAEALGVDRSIVQRQWERCKVRARAEGRPVPSERVDEIRRVG